MHESEIKTNENGSVCVKENKIIVKNPIGNGNFPIIVPPLQECLYINREVVTRPSMVKEEDLIEFKEIKTSKVNYKTSETDREMHTILTAIKKEGDRK